MKVLHVLDRSVPNLSGYSVRSKYILESQLAIGLEPLAVTSPLFDHPQAYDCINGIDYHRTNFELSGNKAWQVKVPFLRELAIIKVLSKQIERICALAKVEIIHAHSPSLCGLAALAVGKKLNIPVVYEVRAFWEDAAVDLRKFTEGSSKYKVSQYMEGKLFKQADAVIAICQGLHQEISQRSGRADIRIMQNGVDIDAFVPLIKNTELWDRYELGDKILVGFIGTFFTFEGLELLVRNIKEITKRADKICFMLIGAGVEGARLRALAKEQRLGEDKLIFTGKVPHSEVNDYYSLMDILVYPRLSKRITELVTPLKPLEAMAMEKAVLVSDVGGLRELIHDGEDAISFEADNGVDLVDKILRLAQNPQLRLSLGQKARINMCRERNWKELIKGYRDIYENLLRRKP
jgi:glycogen synthase